MKLPTGKLLYSNHPKNYFWCIIFTSYFASSIFFSFVASYFTLYYSFIFPSSEIFLSCEVFSWKGLGLGESGDLLFVSIISSTWPTFYLAFRKSLLIRFFKDFLDMNTGVLSKNVQRIALTYFLISILEEKLLKELKINRMLLMTFCLLCFILIY